MAIIGYKWLQFYLNRCSSLQGQDAEGREFLTPSDISDLDNWSMTSTIRLIPSIWYHPTSSIHLIPSDWMQQLAGSGCRGAGVPDLLDNYHPTDTIHLIPSIWYHLTSTWYHPSDTLISSIHLTPSDWYHPTGCKNLVFSKILFCLHFLTRRKKPHYFSFSSHFHPPFSASEIKFQDWEFCNNSGRGML